MRDAEKAKIAATKSEEMKTEERVEENNEKDEEMTDANKAELCLKTGLLKDGGKVCNVLRVPKIYKKPLQPAWMNDRKFKKLKGKANAKKNKFEPNKFGIGPHKKVIKNQTKRKK